MRRRLAMLMFLQYAVPGAWVPIFSLHLQIMDFEPGEIAWSCATAALGSLAAPLFWGQLADRWFPVERCICFCALVCSLILWLLASLSEPVGVFFASFGYWFFMIPIFSLGATLTFRQVKHPEKEFGRVRMWGTIGWICASWCLGLWFHLQGLDVRQADLSDAFRWASMIALALSAYALTLPSTPPSRPTSDAPLALVSPWRRLFDAPLRALQLLRQRSFAVYCLCLLATYITVPFPGQLTPLFLKHLGMSVSSLPVILTLNQSLEFVTLFLLPVILFRLELRNTLLLGIAAWTVMLSVLAVGTPTWLVVVSLGMQGIYICCFLVAGQVFVNNRARHDFRASAQSMLQLINGCGLLCGHLLVGFMRDFTDESFVGPFATSACIAATAFVVLLVGFDDKVPLERRTKLVM